MQTNDPLYELVRAITAAPSSGDSAATGEAGSAASAGGALEQNTEQLAQLRSLFQSQIQAVAENTLAVANNTTKSQPSGSTTAQTVASSLGAGLLISPILSGLMQLFGGGDSDPAPAALAKYAMPAAVNLTASTDGRAVDYGQNGLPRTANVIVQVNAMDSQSFLDRSAEIASAVRRAMLESSSLNDVVAEL